MLKEEFKKFAQDKKEIDHNDYWYIKNNPLSKVGIFPYLGRQISDELEPNKVYNVLRPEEELNKPETLESFKLIPIVDDHTMLGTKDGMQPAEEKGIHGVVGSDVTFNNGVISGDLKIYSEELKNKIENGKKELSMGYFCEYDVQEGTYNGQHYDAIQRNIKANHLALVQEGRMGHDVRVMDCKITFDSITELKDTIQQKEFEMAKDEKVVEEKDKCKDEDVEEKAQDEEVKEEAKDEDIEKEEKAEDEGEEVKDEEKEKKEDAKAEDTAIKGVSMDEVIKELAKRDALVEKIKPLIGDNVEYKAMDSLAVAKYACDKLELSAPEGHEEAFLNGYLIAHAKKSEITYSLDSQVQVKSDKDVAFAEYIGE